MVLRLRKLKFSNPKTLAVAAVLVVVVVGVYALFFHKSADTIPSDKVPVAHTSSPKKNESVSTSGSASPKSNPSTGGSGTTTPGDLVTPYGSFVSSHKPSASSTEESVCSTTVGATCYIEFTNGSVTKKLDAQQIGGSGSVSWIWKVGQAGLSQGNWQIAAVATLNDQTKTTKDQLELEVQP